MDKHDNKEHGKLFFISPDIFNQLCKVPKKLKLSKIKIKTLKTLDISPFKVIMNPLDFFLNALHRFVKSVYKNQGTKTIKIITLACLSLSRHGKNRKNILQISTFPLVLHPKPLARGDSTK